jgi:hypothetical protein
LGPQDKNKLGAGKKWAEMLGISKKTKNYKRGRRSCCSYKFVGIFKKLAPEETLKELEASR